VAAEARAAQLQATLERRSAAAADAERREASAAASVAQLQGELSEAAQRLQVKACMCICSAKAYASLEVHVMCVLLLDPCKVLRWVTPYRLVAQWAVHER
jgi:hypothetical protein